jgi:hypothetical protein
MTTLPDLTALTAEELESLMAHAAQLREDKINAERIDATQTQETLEGEITSTGIQRVNDVATSARARKGKTNADVAANVGREVKDLSQEVAILARQVSILQHLVAHKLTDVTLPEDA